AADQHQFHVRVAYRGAAVAFEGVPGADDDHAQVVHGPREQRVHGGAHAVEAGGPVDHDLHVRDLPLAVGVAAQPAVGGDVVGDVGVADAVDALLVAHPHGGAEVVGAGLRLGDEHGPGLHQPVAHLGGLPQPEDGGHRPGGLDAAAAEGRGAADVQAEGPVGVLGEPVGAFDEADEPGVRLGGFEVRLQVVGQFLGQRGLGEAQVAGDGQVGGGVVPAHVGRDRAWGGDDVGV